ncbi:MAG TPA: GAF domain-containing protein [Labilithrix sp.]|nr:GAF domain-containing protein [Labilithrix sp.]
MKDRVLSALRDLRAIEADDERLAQRLLEVVLAATASTAATLRHPLAPGEVRVGRKDLGARAERLERSFGLRTGAAVLTLHRISAPFDDADAELVEVLGGEVAMRLDQARAEAEASRSRRQIELLRALSRGGEEAQGLAGVADGAARELLLAFTGAHVLVHVVVEQHLELIARRLEHGSGIASAPGWIRHLPLDGASVMAIAAREKQAVSRPVDQLPRARRAFLEKSGVRQLLAVPLLFHDAVFGTITVAHRHDEPWAVDSIRLLESAAAQLGVEVAHVRLLEAERRRAEDLGLVNEIGSLVAQHLELRAVLTTAATELARITDVPRVHVFLADDARTVLRGVACTEDDYADIVLPLTSNAAVVHAYRTLQPVLVDQARGDPRANRDLVAQVGARALLAVPLVSRGEAIGAIILVEGRRPRAFTTTEVARVVAVANLVAPAAANAKMFEDLRRSYEALAQTQADLVMHERLAALGELSAVIAHEVRNPVAIIFNSLGELRRLEPPTDDANLLLDILGEEAGRLNRIVGDLLDFVRPYTAHPRHVQLDAIVDGAVEAARRNAGDPSFDIRTEARLACNDLVVDGTMLQQVLINLIVNAIQATPKGRTVTVSTSAQTVGEETMLRCEVADDGPGIDAANTGRVFQPFFTTKATGTGLGLALVRRLADALGGSVEVGRAPSGGSLFTLLVPLVPTAPEP